jgi:hypothetical protein
MWMFGKTGHVFEGDMLSDILAKSCLSLHTCWKPGYKGCIV